MKIIISLWGLFALISAQTLDINALRGAQMNSPMLGLGNSTVTRETQTLNIHLMDRPVNKSKYIVGPGDDFYSRLQPVAYHSGYVHTSMGYLRTCGSRKCTFIKRDGICYCG